MAIRVSIILPSLNVVDYIEETLKSVKEQSIREIEIICIDAGSTDGTLELIQKYAQGDDRFTVLSSPVKSYGYQVNMGLEIARGEYIAILETDDYVTKDMYRILYENGEKWNVDYLKCDYSAFYTDKKKDRRIIKRKISTDSRYYKKIFCPRNNPKVAMEDWYLWNGVYRNDFIRNNQIRLSDTPGAAFQDIGFLHQVMSCAQNAVFIPDNLYRYRIDRATASSNSDKTLFFIRQEYELLSGEEEKGKRVCELFYKRMAKSFVLACMHSSDDMLNDCEVSEICEWFRKKLLYAQKLEMLSVEDLPFNMHTTYCKLLDSVPSYVDERKTRAEELRLFLEHNEGVIIFGCGSYGMEAYNFLTEKGYTIEAFMDNNQELWGCKINGIEVLNPKETSWLPDNMCYIIANEKHSIEIERQLRSMKHRIKIFTFF